MISELPDAGKVKELKHKLSTAQRVVLTCHVRPDGDAMGSTLALCSLLNKMGKKARVVTPDQPPRSLSFLPGISDVVPLTKYPDFAPRLLKEADLIFCCDYNAPKRTDSLEPHLMGSDVSRVLIDHHESPEDFCDLSFSFPRMSSTSELVFRLICALGLAEEIDKEIATCLATGIITDTRNLSVNCDNPELLLIMYELLRQGVDKRRIIEEALDSVTADSFKLRLYALGHKMELFTDLQTAITCLDAVELKRFNYVRGDTEGLVNEPLNIRGFRASFFLREDDKCVKISARSKGGFIVRDICADLFGGGGHLQAAGGEFSGSLAEARKILVEALPKYASKYSNSKKK